MQQDKYIRYPVSNDFKNEKYDKVYKHSIEDKVGFWTEQAKELTWTKPATKVLDTSD